MAVASPHCDAIKGSRVSQSPGGLLRIGWRATGHGVVLLFNSWEFAFFFLVVLALYSVTRAKAQNLILLVASYFFYGWWDWRFLSLIAVSTAVDYLVAPKIHALGDDKARTRKAWLMVSVLTNLGFLGFFKYFGFFVESAVVLLTTIGFEPNQPTLEIILPVGISFYTFQTLAYSIDIYRRRTEPVRELSLFALYVCYFPQLVAGPIERPSHLVPSRTLRHRRAKRCSSGSCSSRCRSTATSPATRLSRAAPAACWAST
jgi:alginate O-acetyltransferase complex protein AlgI